MLNKLLFFIFIFKLEKLTLFCELFQNTYIYMKENPTNLPCDCNVVCLTSNHSYQLAHSTENAFFFIGIVKGRANIQHQKSFKAFDNLPCTLNRTSIKIILVHSICTRFTKLSAVCAKFAHSSQK